MKFQSFFKNVERPENLQKIVYPHDVTARVLVHYLVTELLRYDGKCHNCTCSVCLHNAEATKKKPQTFFFSVVHHRPGNSIDKNSLPYRTMWCWRQRR